jgi:hypothetical protein
VELHGGSGLRAITAFALFYLLSVSPGSTAGDSGNGHENINFMDISGSGDWEFYRTESLSQGRTTSFNAIRQRYSVDLSGSLWDYRFNRYNLGLDLFLDDRRNEGVKTDSRTVGYRADTTFFPNRLYPLRLFARRSVMDTTGLALADSNRETAAWGAEWVVATRKNQRAKIQFDRTAYDLLSPIALRNRRTSSTVELTQRFRRRETHLRYGYHQQKELVQSTEFSRHDINLTDRTRFDNGVVILFNGTHTLSDALFSTGDTDELTQKRASVLLDIPRRKRFGFNASYDFIDNAGMFVNSDSHQARATMRVFLGQYVEMTTGLSSGTLESVTASQAVVQDSVGANLGLRFNRTWDGASLTASYTTGLRDTEFDTGENRSIVNHGADVQLRVPIAAASLFGSVTAKQDENDASGVGFTYDEIVGRVGVERGIGEIFHGRLDMHHRNTVYDTFEFGIQESTEYGIEGAMDHDRGGISLMLATGDGISDYIPDPSGVGVFLPGTDLVQQFDSATVGVHWSFGRTLRLRMRARLEEREFTSIGHERIVSYHPEVEWRPGAWRFTFGISNYQRDNGTAFEQNTVQFRASRKFF